MKIAFVASAGGHLAQIQKIFSEEVIDNNEYIIITEKNTKTEKLKNTYLFDYLRISPIKTFIAIIKCFKIFRKEKVKLVITTGAELGDSALIAAKMLGIKTVFIETIIRVKTPTLTGKIAYPFSDYFLVQHNGMEKLIGKKAMYRGGII